MTIIDSFVSVVGVFNLYQPEKKYSECVEFDMYADCGEFRWERSPVDEIYSIFNCDFSASRALQIK